MNKSWWSWVVVSTMVAAASCSNEEPVEGAAPHDISSDIGAQEAEPQVGSGSKTAYPGGRWSVPEATYGAVVEKNVTITMSDGVVPVGDVSYPTDLTTGRRSAGTFPVLLTQNPYGGVSGASSRFFVTHGYIFASVWNA